MTPGVKCPAQQCRRQDVPKIDRNFTLQIFPVENISGRKAVESGNTCLRKTVSGSISTFFMDAVFKPGLSLLFSSHADSLDCLQEWTSTGTGLMPGNW